MMVLRVVYGTLNVVGSYDASFGFRGSSTLMRLILLFRRGQRAQWGVSMLS